MQVVKRVVVAASVILGCAPAPRAAGEAPTIEAIAADLDARSRGLTAQHAATFRAILADTLAKDPYRCAPAPREVFFGAAPPNSSGERTISGVMPHYGFFFGPMRYRLRRVAGRWEVAVTIAIEPPRAADRLELPDCASAREIGGDAARCSGTPYAEANSTDACPGSGSFSAPASTTHVRALLRRWSREAETYWNRDAAFFELPVRYDFEFVLADEAPPERIDLTVPLSPTCGRTPYFSAFRSGWSLPIVAHEVGHVLGLLDEYEALSGVLRFYPKTPFPGAERSRMGLSMREGTRLLPLHHYLVLRRYFCAEPERGGFYERGLPM